MQHKIPPEVDPEDNNNKFSDYFNFVSVLGSGSFGVVVAARDKKHENGVCAVKIMKKKSMTIEFIDGLRKEAYILSKFNHPSIVTFKRLIETETQFFLVMECLHGGHLNSLMKKRVENKQKFSEEEASTILQGIASALEYIHGKDIVHRDIKPENILFADSKDLSSAKIVDFGLSAQYEFQIHQSFTERCGTRAYMAPELFRKMEYSKPIDVWSLGVIMYQLLNCGKHPLYESTDTLESYEMKIKNCQTIPPSSCSSLAKQLLTKLLAYEANERYSAAEILQHPWITRRFSDKIPLTFNDRMKSFYHKQTIIRVIKATGVIKYLQRMSEVEPGEDSQQLDSTSYYNNESIDHSIQSNIKEIRLLPSIMPNFLRQSSDTTTNAGKSAYKTSSFLAVPQSIGDIISARKTKNRSDFSRPETVVLKKQITPDSSDLRKLIQNSLKTKARSAAVSDTFSQRSSSPERDFSALSMGPFEKQNSYKSSSSNNSLKNSKFSYSDLGQKSDGSPELKKPLQSPIVLVNNSYPSPEKPKGNSYLESSYSNDTREETEELKPLQYFRRNILTEFTIHTNKRSSMNLSQERALTPKKTKEDSLSPIKIFKQSGDYSGIFTEGNSDPRSSLKNIRRSPNTQSMKNLNSTQIISDDVPKLSPLKRSSEILKLTKTDVPSEKVIRYSSLPKSSRFSSGYPALQNVREMFANSKVHTTDQSPRKIRLPALKVNEHTQRNKVSLSSERKSQNSPSIFKPV